MKAWLDNVGSSRSNMRRISHDYWGNDSCDRKKIGKCQYQFYCCVSNFLCLLIPIRKQYPIPTDMWFEEIQQIEHKCEVVFFVLYFHKIKQTRACHDNWGLYKIVKKKVFLVEGLSSIVN